MREPRPDDPRQAWSTAMRLSSLGLYMGICLGLGSYLGVLADHRWHTGVVWTLVGFAVGVAAGFYGLFNELGRLNSK